MTEDKFKVERVRKLDKLRELGIDSYGGRFDGVEPVTHIRDRADRLGIDAGVILDGERARVAGRIVLQRVMGNLIFLTIRDVTGDLQLGLSKRALKEQWPAIKQMDLGDLVGADGMLGRTKTNELTVWADQITFLGKCLHQPPGKWHGLTDVELRYRHRYVDLFTNPEVRSVFKQRSRIIQAIRDYLTGLGYFEVDTPVLQPIYGGAAARPFTTHHNALDLDLYLRISPELYLKRLLVGGMERVFEFSRSFRNEGISTRHNPEFTMLEFYEAYADYRVMMERAEQMVAAAIERIGGGFKRPFRGHELDFTVPWARCNYADLLHEYAGVEMNDIAAVRAKAQTLGIDHQGLADAVVVNKVFEETVEPHLIQPTFVYDYPAELCPLTHRHPDDDSIALRFEAFAAGMELGNAYTELNDSQKQHENFLHKLAGEGDETMAVMDEDFILAMEYGMPPAGGLGVGIDRLVMVLTNSSSIRDVILFPLQKPVQTAEASLDAFISGVETDSDETTKASATDV
ncbi:MAG: lysine--tRNA ligase [Phycisphaerae bacterium]|nr:lysine--tRNA ligase [Phycisphaerae bacterium]